MSSIKFNADEQKIYDKYSNLTFPRHTSYPAAPFWQDYTNAQRDAALTKFVKPSDNVGIYIHIPFCRQLCNYCGCTREIHGDEQRAKKDPSDDFLEGLKKELASVASTTGTKTINQFHLGGGTPTFLTPTQLQELVEMVDQHFPRSEHCEVSIELDPRVTTDEHLKTIAALGFNRVSLGVQDFDHKVQVAINRIQPFELVRDFVSKIRANGINAINFDLIYGLPFQTLESIADTISKTAKLAPDRIAFYRLAMIPNLFKWQKLFKPEDMPDPNTVLQMQLDAIGLFAEQNYEFLGLDHFAKADDALSIAHKNGKMQRTFQGMTTGKQINTVGLGPSAISILNGAFYQNEKSVNSWTEAVSNGTNTIRGLNLTDDDLFRKEVLQDLYGYGVLDYAKYKSNFGIDFPEYFSKEWPNILRLRDEGVLKIESDRISLSDLLGRVLVRVAASALDPYLPPSILDTGMVGSSSKI